VDQSGSVAGSLIELLLPVVIRESDTRFGGPPGTTFLVAMSWTAPTVTPGRMLVGVHFGLQEDGPRTLTSLGSPSWTSLVHAVTAAPSRSGSARPA
jgi:hypothetical protein